MQNSAIDAMAKKYKEEMMRLYSGRTSAAANMTEKPDSTAVNGTSQQPPQRTEQRETDRLMHPPMPRIPVVSQKNEVRADENAPARKFPNPDELLARFDNADGHEQGNYDFTEAQREQTFEGGEGFFMLEVNGGGQPLDCALAAVFRATDSGDVLTATFFTDEKGETEVITLPVLGLDEKYTVTVAKEGFFTVRDLEVPIFDSIKSIQPVELKMEQQ